MDALQPTSENIKPLSQVPYGSIIVNSENQKGVILSLPLDASRCRVYFFDLKRSVELEWSEVVEVIIRGASSTLNNAFEV